MAATWLSVLPGGLTRVGADPTLLIISSHSDGTSKDTWVASTEPALQQSTWLRSARTTVRPPVLPDVSTPLPGRVAAQLFVLGRTAEHAELVIRLIRTVLARLDQPLGVGMDGGAESFQVLLAALGTVSGFDPVSEPDEDEGPDVPAPTAPAVPVGASTGSPEPGSELPTDRRALALLLDAGVDGSLVSSLALLVDAAYSVREQLSGDTWQLVGDVEEELARLRNRPPTQLVGVQSSLQRLLQALLALAGLSAENMERDSAWLFLDAGRRLERAQSLVRLLRAVLVRQRAAVVEDLLLESLLKTSESLIIFRRRSGSTMRVAGAVDLLVYDAANPRSVIYQLDRLVDQLAELPKQWPAQRLGHGDQLVLEITTLLRLTDAAQLAIVDADAGRRPGLDSVLGRVEALLAELLDSLRHTYFSHERLSMLTGLQHSLGGRRARVIAAGSRTRRHRTYRIVHRTLYRYSGPGFPRPQRGPSEAPRLRRQHCLSNEIVAQPAPTSWSERTDFFGNPVASFAVDGPFSELTVTSTSTVSVSGHERRLLWGRLGAGTGHPGRRPLEETLAAREFCFESPLVPLPRRTCLRPALVPARPPLIEVVSELTERIFVDYLYDPGFTTVTTPFEEVIGYRRGVCQDFAHLAIGCLRSMGLAARYVSGYLETAPPARRATGSSGPTPPTPGPRCTSRMGLAGCRPDQRSDRRVELRDHRLGP